MTVHTERIPTRIQRWWWSVECEDGALIAGWAITRRGAERAARKAEQDYRTELWERQKQKGWGR